MLCSFEVEASCSLFLSQGGLYVLGHVIPRPFTVEVSCELHIDRPNLSKEYNSTGLERVSLQSHLNSTGTSLAPGALSSDLQHIQGTTGVVVVLHLQTLQTV